MIVTVNGCEVFSLVLVEVEEENRTLTGLLDICLPDPIRFMRILLLSLFWLFIIDIANCNTTNPPAALAKETQESYGFDS